MLTSNLSHWHESVRACMTCLGNSCSGFLVYIFDLCSFSIAARCRTVLAEYNMSCDDVSLQMFSTLWPAVHICKNCQRFSSFCADGETYSQASTEHPVTTLLLWRGLCRWPRVTQCLKSVWRFKQHRGEQHWGGYCRRDGNVFWKWTVWAFF